jgi:hypothetical protein
MQRLGGVGREQYSVDMSRGSYLLATWGAAKDDAWAVGESGLVAHWDGVEWVRYRTPDQTHLTAVTGCRGLVYAAGELGRVWSFSEGEWRADTSLTTRDWADVACEVETQTLWAVGREGVVARRDDAGWALLPSPTMDDLTAVAVVPGLGVLVGDRVGKVHRFSDPSWSLDGTLADRIRDLFVATPDDVWAVTEALSPMRDNETWRRRGGLWASRQRTGLVESVSLWVGPEEVAWMATTGEGIARREQGRWAFEPHSRAPSLRAIWGVPGRIWAVGGAWGDVLSRQTP